METLRKLERVQGMLSLMQARGISAGQPDSDRFLAEFFLFMVQPCAVTLEKRCELIHEHLLEISAALLEEACPCYTEEETSAELPMNFSNNGRGEICSSNIDEGLSLIGLNAMQRANSTLEDFGDWWRRRGGAGGERGATSGGGEEKYYRMERLRKRATSVMNKFLIEFMLVNCKDNPNDFLIR
ncbi:hypothetical protein Taro_044536 [Colocasia esculenta]|uniref:Uncharacterized protein n=1 Tax=Colocasia esculenta TaxID=4460 RepID=A0A843X2X1_COLES|nr:hypothetical protein [Colocasia esculenta]